MSGTGREGTGGGTETERRILGERLREAREYLGLSQEDVARALEIPRTALSNVETGQRKVDAIELKRLAALYKRPLSFFTGEASVEPVYGEEVAHIARKVAKLSAEDQAELSRFADFLRSRKSTQEV